MNVLTWLERAVSTCLPDRRGILSDPSIWRGKDVNYHPPRVRRLWTPFGPGRLMLHVIDPIPSGERPLFHPHPWEAAVFVAIGTYIMEVSRGPGPEPPSVACVISCPEGTTYVMDDPTGWHSVAPVGEPVMSVMLSGQLFADSVPTDIPAPHPDQIRPLSSDQTNDLLRAFRDLFWSRDRAGSNRRGPVFRARMIERI